MGSDFWNFTILYTMLFLSFALIGNINFMYELKDFENIFTSSLTVINASIGNFDFEIFEEVNDPTMKLFGQIFMLVVIICFNLILLNLIIAILGNTYNMYDQKSNGLYLTEILSKRDELIYDENYGAFLTSIPPINSIVLPFLPFGLFLRQDSDILL